VKYLAGFMLRALNTLDGRSLDEMVDEDLQEVPVAYGAASRTFQREVIGFIESFGLT
jgi:hypothetical protein